MRADRRKALKAQYGERKVIGGVYRVINRENGRFHLNWTGDMQSMRNRFDSCRALGSSFMPSMLRDWALHGPEAFAMEELELLEKKEEQTDAEFSDDLKVLLALWEEKLPQGDRY